MDKYIFWSEIGSGFEEPGGAPPLTEGHHYVFEFMFQKVALVTYKSWFRCISVYTGREPALTQDT